MATLSDIRRTIRNITGRKDINQLSDARIDDYINDFYLYDFPERLKVLNLEDYYKFYTSPNVSRYKLPQDYYLVKPPCFVSGYQVGWHQSPELFFAVWPDARFSETAAIGNGGTTYTFIVTGPVQDGTITISSPSEYVTDYINLTAGGLPNGVLLSNTTTGGGPANVNGTINYVTGAITVVFNAAVPVGSPIIAQYYRYVASRPRDVLFFSYEWKTSTNIGLVFTYNSEKILSFELRPIPNITYEVRVGALRSPTAMLAAGDSPDFTEWCNLIAYGAALKIFIENADWDEYRNLYPVFEEQRRLAQRRAIKQIGSQRSQTQYSFSAGGTVQWPLFPIY